MIYCVIISLIMMVAFTILVCRKGIPSSLSESFYKIKYPYWFSAIMIVASLLMMYPMFTISDTDFEFLPFLICGGLLFVGVAPKFSDDEIQSKAHQFGAIVAAIAAEVYAFICNPWLLLLNIPFAMMAIIQKSKYLFWMEIGIILITYLTTLLNIICK